MTHRGQTATLPTSRGVRQGCKASPIEWTIFLCAILLRIDMKLWTQEALWTHRHLLTYADDLITRWKILSASDFQTCLEQLGSVLEILHCAGMTVNFQKTVVLMRLAGSQSKSIWKKHTFKQHGNIFLRVPHSQGCFHLPIVHEHIYLGVKISYYNFEDSTLRHRLHISRVTFLLETIAHRQTGLAFAVKS